MLQVYTNCSEAIPFNLFSLKLFGVLIVTLMKIVELCLLLLTLPQNVD